MTIQEIAIDTTTIAVLATIFVVGGLLRVALRRSSRTEAARLAERWTDRLLGWVPGRRDNDPEDSERSLPEPGTEAKNDD